MFSLPLFLSLICICLVHSSALEAPIADCHPAEAGAFERALRGGHWPCAHAAIPHALQAASSNGSGSSSGTDEEARVALLSLKATLEVSKRQWDSEYSSLHSAIDAALPGHGQSKVTITPAFEWCQSATHIYINVKFAHKLDAPATLNVEAESVALEESKVRLLASSSKGSLKSFVLEFPLFAHIVPQNSSYSMASVGRMSLVLAKAASPSKWPRLVPKSFNAQKVLGKAVLHFWHDLHRNYVSELELLDDEEDDEDDRKAKQKKRESKESAETKARLQREREEKEAEEAGRAAAAAAAAEVEAEAGAGQAGIDQQPKEAALAAAALELDPEL